MSDSYDAVLLLSFGGPEAPEDVEPFLKIVLRGKPVPPDRVKEVAGHYLHFGGVSPINDQCRALLAALENELGREGPKLPLYWGNRNWHPFLGETLKQMATDGVRRALAFVTSAYSSYSGCRQYLEDIERAQAEVGADAPEVEKLRAFYNHPGFVEPLVERTRVAFDEIPQERRAAARLVFTAHSLPLAWARSSDYQDQLKDTASLVAQDLGRLEWGLVYQSRSGPPSQPWLEPDIVDHLRALARDGVRDVVVAPIGFISDHMEVVYDLDLEAKSRAVELGLNMVRAGTVGTHPRFVRMIGELVRERLDPSQERLSRGGRGPAVDVCAGDCCPIGARPAFREPD